MQFTDSSPLLLAGSTALAAYAFTWLARGLAPRLGLLDRPDGKRKIHRRPTPLLGGGAVCLAVLGVVVVTAGVGAAHAGQLTSAIAVAPTLVSATLFCLLGVCDDARPIRPRTKLLGQVLAALPFAIWGASIKSVELLGGHFDLGPLAVPFTVFWIVACANALNLLDGLDGLASSVALIACFTTAAVTALAGGSAAILTFILAGSLFGFLLHNAPPARIFLGDAGSLSIGFLLGALFIDGSLTPAGGFRVAMPLIIFSVPVFDTSMAIVRRKLKGRGLGQADRGHLHHALLARGLSPTQTLLAISGIGAAVAGMALLATHIGSEALGAITCLAILSLLPLARIFAHDEAGLLLRRARTGVVGLFGAFRTPHTPAAPPDAASSWPEATTWRGLREWFFAVGGMELHLVCRRHSDNDMLADECWTSRRQQADTAQVWRIHCSIPCRQHLHVTVAASGLARTTLSRQYGENLLSQLETLCRQWALEKALDASLAPVNVDASSIPAAPARAHPRPIPSPVARSRAA